MTRKVATITFVSTAALVLGIAYFLVRAPKSDGLAKVHMLDIGQGDSFLIQAANGKQLIIDGGKDDSVLLELAKVMPRGDRSIDVVIATHPDADHIGGLPLVLSRYKVDLFLTSHVLADTETFESLYRTLEEKGIPSYYVRDGMTLSLDKSLPTHFAVLFPDRETLGWETNAASVVGRLEVGERSALFTGDAPSSIEDHLQRSSLSALDVDILKLGHHGSKTSTSESFLKMTSPRLALISAGVNNRYGHPAPEVTNRLTSLSIPFVSTQDVGTFTLTTDGVKWYRK